MWIAPALLVFGCATSQVQTLDPARVDALRSELEARTSRETPAAAAVLSTPLDLPRDDGERRARAQAALSPEEALGSLRAVGGGRYGLALAVAGQESGSATLRLFDLGATPGTLVAAHRFGTGSVAGGGPARIDEVFELLDPSGRSAVFAELVSREGVRTLCGWRLSARRPELLCAPSFGKRSRYRAHRGALLETWPSGAPTEPLRPAGISGRTLVLTDDGWRELDAFRCLSQDLERALAEAEPQRLGRWQRNQIASRRSAAFRAIDRLEAKAAAALLEDALAIDACDVDTWRILGRLQREAGHAEQAVPTLAVAVALRPHGEAAVLDLADALVDLDAASEHEPAWSRACDVLMSRKGVRAVLGDRSVERPRDLARILYEYFLVLTERSAPRLGPQRRRARAQLERLAARPG